MQLDGTSYLLCCKRETCMHNTFCSSASKRLGALIAETPTGNGEPEMLCFVMSDAMPVFATALTPGLSIYSTTLD